MTSTDWANLSDEDLASIAEWEAEEILPKSVVQQRFRYRSYVSRYEWGGSPRKRWVDVELIYDTHSDRWYSYDHFPFDIMACEVYGVYENGLDGLVYEDRLRAEIRTCERRRTMDRS